MSRMSRTAPGDRPARFSWQLDDAVTGGHRSMEPAGALPHLATRLDADAPLGAHEAFLDVELLNIDATSYRVIRDRAGADPVRMAALVREVVADRGKLQNPWTGSGGVLVGRVDEAGDLSPVTGMAIGSRVVPLVSLIALPLRLDDVGPVDPSTPQVPARGRAVVTGRMPVAEVPDDLPLDVALTAFDVYPVAWHVRDRARPGDHVLVLGAGHAGLLAAAAGTEQVGPVGRVTVVDTSEAALGRLVTVAPGARAVRADATDAAAVVRALDDDGAGPSDLTLVCASAAGCEGTAILTTAPDGTVLFFSTATTFPAAALGVDALGTTVSLVIPNGCTPDRGGYTLDLLRANPFLLDAFRHRPGPS
jgi:L-erythro-3,5-diaminohexanoate dehydrogenase